jgi:quercetin dioxygenase-like cupin family protein
VRIRARRRLSKLYSLRSPVLPSSSLLVATAPAPDPSPAFPRLELQNLFQIASWSDKIVWQPFRDGVDIYRLHGDGITGPTTALIRFRKTGKVPLHKHAGWEHILVLAGSQRDQNTTANAGTLMINPPGTAHSVVGEAGCIVLAIYEHPVQFVPEPGPV